MSAAARSVSDVLQNIAQNIQEIVRFEILLAKTEIREEFSKATDATALLASGAAAGIFATLFLLLAAVYALATVVSSWVASLIVGGVLMVFAALMLAAGSRRLKRLRPTPQRTVKMMKENVEWVKQHTK